MAKKTQDIKEFTLAALEKVPKPWPDYITLLVFLAIENDDSLLQQYWDLVTKYDQTEEHKDDGQGHVNNTIPKIVKRISRRETGKKDIQAKSSLVKTYSKLV